MRINRIELNNFGSYEGNNIFEMQPIGDKNIVLIGGKNGAGKTTLFTAMRICLYGFMSMGYRNANSYYNRAIIKLINNNAKMAKPTQANVTMHFDLSNGRGLDHYVLERKWVLEDALDEEFSIAKNGVALSPEEIADFEKYLLSLIPPELFNLYFFDGEKIADFFLDEGSNTRIKDAFLTLCGYDTFDIMRKNFKRLSASGQSTKKTSLTEYVEAKEKAKTENDRAADLQQQLNECIIAIENCSSDIDALDKDYTNKGGITEEEWNQKLYLLKDEERKRENWNALLRKWANDIIPFIMIASTLEKVKQQIEKENSDFKCRGFVEILRSKEISELIGDQIERIEGKARELFGSQEDAILELSFEQSANLLSQVNALLTFDGDKISKCKKLIKQSIAKSAKIRKELEQSNISSVQEYMRTRSSLFEKKSELLNLRIALEKAVSDQRDVVSQATQVLSKAQAILEEEIKKESITDISAKAIIMLDKLQADLYHRQINRVEESFRQDIAMLMRKKRFIDDIEIDDSFNIHVYRNEDVLFEQIYAFISNNGREQFIAVFGDKACEALQAQYGEKVFENHDVLPKSGSIGLPIEIDKTSFSNGEKQIFIMALYHSLVQLGNHEIPFVIDTPFARIDTEHRQNIAKHFFSSLKGQVFILSTNEEITSSHVEIMKEKILAMYMLENSDNKRTVVLKDAYFEV